jgi:hypothetical protein
LTQDYEDAFTELVLLGQKTWNDNNMMKRQLVQNAQNIGMVETTFEELVSEMAFIETCNFLRSHAIKHDQQNKETSTKQIQNTYQSPGTGTNKKDKIKAVLALINEL